MYFTLILIGSSFNPDKCCKQIGFINKMEVILKTSGIYIRYYMAASVSIGRVGFIIAWYVIYSIFNIHH